MITFEEFVAQYMIPKMEYFRDVLRENPYLDTAGKCAYSWMLLEFERVLSQVYVDRGMEVPQFITDPWRGVVLDYDKARLDKI